MKLHKGGRLSFPEPLQKEIVMSFFDKTLKKACSSPYDFQGNIELKSSTLHNGGCTPFKKTQNQCSRIIYMEIGTAIDVFELSSLDVQAINNTISSSASHQTNITLSQYKQNSTKQLSLP